MRVKVEMNCYLNYFEGQPRPRHFTRGQVIDFDLPVDEDHPLPPCLVPLKLAEQEGGQEVVTAPEGAERPSLEEAAVAQSDSRKLAVMQAVTRLDPENDDHWTAGGLPAVHAVANELGDDTTRDEIKVFAPEATRPDTL